MPPWQREITKKRCFHVAPGGGNKGTSPNRLFMEDRNWNREQPQGLDLGSWVQLRKEFRVKQLKYKWKFIWKDTGWKSESRKQWVAWTQETGGRKAKKTPGEREGKVRENLSRIFFSFPGVSPEGCGLQWLVGPRAGDFSHPSWSRCQPWPVLPAWPWYFSGPGADTQLRPRYYLSLDQNPVSVVSGPEALFLRLFHAGQNLLVLKASCLWG